MLGYPHNIRATIPPMSIFSCHTSHYCSSKLSKNDSDSHPHLEAYTASPSTTKASGQHRRSFLIHTSLNSPVMLPKCALSSAIGHYHQVLLDSLEHCQQLALFEGNIWGISDQQLGGRYPISGIGLFVWQTMAIGMSIILWIGQLQFKHFILTYKINA